jgi:hypothetical protein
VARKGLLVVVQPLAQAGHQVLSVILDQVVQQVHQDLVGRLERQVVRCLSVDRLVRPAIPDHPDRQVRAAQDRLDLKVHKVRVVYLVRLEPVELVVRPVAADHKVQVDRLVPSVPADRPDHKEQAVQVELLVHKEPAGQADRLEQVERLDRKVQAVQVVHRVPAGHLEPVVRWLDACHTPSALARRHHQPVVRFDWTMPFGASLLTFTCRSLTVTVTTRRQHCKH